MTTSTGSRPLRVLVVGHEREDGSRFQAFVDELPGTLTLEWLGTFEAGLEAMTTGGFDATLVDCRLGAKTGIELLRAVGIERIFARVEELAGRCIDGLAERGADLLTPLDPAQRAGVIAFRHDDALGLFDLCRSRGVDIGAIGAVRVDPHAFNNEDDIDRFLACCDAFTPASVGHASRE